jgi:hypothetical protein
MTVTFIRFRHFCVLRQVSESELKTDSKTAMTQYLRMLIHAAYCKSDVSLKFVPVMYLFINSYQDTEYTPQNINKYCMSSQSSAELLTNT